MTAARPASARARARHDVEHLAPAAGDAIAEQVLELVRRLAAWALADPILDTASNCELTRSALPAEVLHASTPEYRP